MAVIHDASGRGIGEGNPLRVQQDGSNVMIPVDVQARYATTVQTQNGVNVLPSSSNVSSWIDTDGFTEICFTMNIDASVNNSATLTWSNDGSTDHGWDQVLAQNTSQKRAASTQTKARFVRCQVDNKDTLPHVISAWAYLKA